MSRSITRLALAAACLSLAATAALAQQKNDEEYTRLIKQFLRDFIVRVRATMTNVAKLLGREPDQINIVALHMLFVGAAVLNVARDDANSRRECAEIARIAIETFLIGDDPVPAIERQRRRK